MKNSSKKSAAPKERKKRPRPARRLQEVKAVKPTNMIRRFRNYNYSDDKRTGIKRYVNLWNRFALDNDLPVTTSVTLEMQETLNWAIEKRRSPTQLIRSISRQPFLMGDNDIGFKISLEWLLLTTTRFTAVYNCVYYRRHLFARDVELK